MHVNSEIIADPRPSAPVDRPLSPQEREKILVQWNDTKFLCNTDRCIHWLFEEQVNSAPLAPAVDDGHAVLSYSDLNARANRVAHHLLSSGIGRGNLVGVCMERSPDLIAAILGILKCGAAYVPMEPAWPVTRRESMMRATGIRALLVDSLHDQVGSVSATTKIVAFDNLEVGGFDNIENPARIGAADDRAYLIFTSGSSGDPKAVVVRHRPVINLIDWVNRTFNVGPEDKLLFTTSVAFDLSVYDIFGTLSAGGTIRIADRATLRDPHRLAEILLREKITFWDSAPAALERLLPYFDAHGVGDALRLVFLSGDWISLSLSPAIKRRFARAKVIALGGATEATVWSNFHEIEEIEPHCKSIPYGRPIQNTRYYILDSEMNPCRVGIPGELYIGGACLADGYANDPGLTARKFVPDLFMSGGRMYRTGDRARYFADGTIEFLGRLDRQIKVRGFRVEPAEIETTLQRHSKVRRAVVIAQGDQRGSKRLVAFAVLINSPSQSPTPQELRNFLRQQMPDYMVPSQIAIVPSMPLTLNGKIDVPALQATLLRSDRQFDGCDFPRDRTEQALADIVSRVLRRDRVGIHDSFFDLGGDSLQAVEVLNSAAGVGLNLRLNDLHEHPTIAELVEVGRKASDRPATSAPAGNIPLTPTQLWFFNRRLRFPARYSAAFAFDVSGSLDLERLRDAMRAVQEHHDALRLRFKLEGEQWTQHCAPVPIEPYVEEWDLNLLPESDHLQAVHRRVIDRRVAFDLTHGSLAKAILVNRGPRQGQQLLLVVHHLIFDAVSLNVLVEDLTIAIKQLDRNAPIVLPVSGSFAAWAARLADRAGSDHALAESDYWLGLPWKEVRGLPRDCPTGRNVYRTSQTIRAELPEGETQILLREGHDHFGASTGEILLAACARVLSDWASSTTLLIDLTDHGRHNLFTDHSPARTIGYVTLNVPVVITIPRSASLTDVVTVVRDHLRRMPKWGIGYGLLRYSSPENPVVSCLRRCSNAEVKFNYLGTMTSEGTTTELFHPIHTNFAGVLDPDDERAYLHNLELAVIDSKLQVEWKFNSAVHRVESIETLMEKYVSALRTIIWETRSKGRIG